MRRLYMAALAVAIGLPAAAQDTYESARLLGNDLNGTARYVGMGGAMDALGADLSTIGSNPAGIGLFRHSTASFSFGVVSQQDAKRFDGLGKTNMSFDQLGFVYSSRISRTSFVNFSFNYHKSRNFDQILSAANSMSNVSSMGLSYHKATLGSSRKGGYDLGLNKQDEWVGFEDANSDRRALTFSQVDYLNANVLLEDPNDGNLYYTNADAYEFDRATRGWISNYDFNISGNANDRFYWGITLGLHDVNYKGYSEYAEGLAFSNGSDAGIVAYGDERKIDGTGIDLTAGIIVRPVEDSPFRFGLSVKTPTWYDLTTTNYTEVANESAVGSYDWGKSAESYDFKFYTPWKFGVSLGHTFGTQVALGLGYEYSDYGASQNRINDGYDYYGNESSYTDEVMKANTEQVLKGVSTLKAGIELKPVPEFAVRLGYNYVTAAYDENGVRDMTLDSPGVMYASTTDYTNWKDTHRITCGLGYKVGGFNIDLAYQYSATNGDFHPIQYYETPVSMDAWHGGRSNGDGTIGVSNKRHQLLLTLGYTF